MMTCFAELRYAADVETARRDKARRKAAMEIARDKFPPCEQGASGTTIFRPAFFTTGVKVD